MCNEHKLHNFDHVYIYDIIVTLNWNFISPSKYIHVIFEKLFSFSYGKCFRNNCNIVRGSYVFFGKCTTLNSSYNGLNASRPTYSSSWFIKEGFQTTFVFRQFVDTKYKLNIIIILNTLINTSYICCNQYIYFDMPPEITPSPCAKCVCGSRLPMSITNRTSSLEDPRRHPVSSCRRLSCCPHGLYRYLHLH